MQPSTVLLDDLRTIDALVSEYPNILSASTLRWQLRRRGTNGLARACVRVGRRLLISKSRYDQWLASQTELPACGAKGTKGAA